VLKRTAVDEALPRIVADESSYYLVTYRSSNTKLDGRFRALTARVTRPGVRVRTRRGYRGLTTDDLLSTRRPTAARTASAIPVAGPDARRPFRIRTSSWTAPEGGTFWIVGELDYRLRQELEWTAGATADVVVLAAPQTAGTDHLIGDRELALMKDDAVLVNVSRGSLIDEAALVRALETGRLRGAALDVFEHEPLPAESPLWARTDVLVTPHVSGFHPDHWDTVLATFTENLRRFSAGQPLANSVDKKAGY